MKLTSLKTKYSPKFKQYRPPEKIVFGRWSSPFLGSKNFGELLLWKLPICRPMPRIPRTSWWFGWWVLPLTFFLGGFASFVRNHQRKIAAKFWVTNTKRFESTDLELFLLTYVWDSTTHVLTNGCFLCFFCCWPMGFFVGQKIIP